MSTVAQRCSWMEVLVRGVPLLVAVSLLAAGIGYAYLLGMEMRYEDERAYFRIAGHLASSGRFTLDGVIPTAVWPPAYPAVIAVVRLLGGEVVAVRVINFIFLACTVILVSRILVHVSGSRTAAIGASLLAAYPVLFYTAGTLYPQTLALFLMTLVILSIVRGWHPLVPGLGFGVLILAVPTFAFSLMILLGWYVMNRKHRAALAVFTVVALLVAPWCVRNRLVMGRWAFVSSNSGYNLLLGNSPATTATSGAATDISAVYKNAEGLDEMERDAYFRKRALTFMAADPARTVRLYSLKLLNYFHFTNDLSTGSEAARWKTLMMAFTYLPLLALALGRCFMWKWIPLSRLDILWVAFYLGGAVITAVFFSRIRFRLPYDVLVVLLSAQLLGYRWRRERVSD